AKRGKRRQVKKMSKSPKVKPPIFIGSSSEGYEIAKAVTALLTPQTQPTLWKDDVFLPGSFILETLEALTTNHYFAVFVASPDDNLTSRGQKYAAMRDNVLFECGLFMGAHGIWNKARIIDLSRYSENKTCIRLGGYNYGYIQCRQNYQKPYSCC